MAVSCAGDKFTDRKEQDALMTILAKAETHAIPSQKA